jgi:ubiquitin fusion degradation protein 1
MLFKLKNSKHDRITHCGVLEFLPNDEPHCYLPHWMMDHLLLEEGDEIHIESVHSLPTATFVRFEPQSKTFLDITNPKAVLEKFLRNFSCLTKGDLISINYLNHNYQLFVLDLKPANVVTIIDCDMEVDFAPPIDYIQPKSLSTTTVNEQQLYKNPTTFMPFHGQGNRLNGKIKSNDKEEKNHHEISQTRGIPNYDYKYGSLRFPRIPFRSLNDDINEVLEKNSSTIFQPFTGEGKILRQPRNQRPK